MISVGTSSNLVALGLSQSEYLNILKQLAEDIERSGGIKAFIGGHHILAKVVFDSDLKTYRESGGLLRTVLSKEVTTWKSYYKEGCYDRLVLGKFGVTANKFRTEYPLKQEIVCEKKKESNHFVPPVESIFFFKQKDV